MDNICRLAHVRRGSIYYHFDNKAAILHSVLKQLTTINTQAVQEYCDVQEYLYILSFSVLWEQFLYDEKIRRLILQWVQIDPVIAAPESLWEVHLACFQPFSKNKLHADQISDISSITAYGLITHTILLANENRQNLSSREWLRHCIVNMGRIYNIDSEVVERTWVELAQYIQRLPMEHLRHYPL